MSLSPEAALAALPAAPDLAAAVSAWLKTAGKLDAPPTMDEIVAHIDTQYAEKALGGGCP